MLRMRRTALGCLMLAGCLDPLTDDQPGYSRHILPSGAEVTSVADDPATTRRIDLNDGISMGKAALKSAFAVGLPVKYWDLGAGRGTAVPAYQLARCNADGLPEGEQPDHPLLIDALPGDPDYSQIWAIYYVCVTPAYESQLITSLPALSDAYELGLVNEPKKPLAWQHQPIVLDGVVLDGASASIDAARTVFVRAMRANSVSFGADGAVVTTNGKSVTTGNVYELVRPGSTKVERVVFDSAGFTPEGGRGESYAPVWTVVTVTITADADISTFSKDSDIATVNMDRTFTKASASVVSVVATTNRSARAVQFSEAEP